MCTINLLPSFCSSFFSLKSQPHFLCFIIYYEILVLVLVHSVGFLGSKCTLKMRAFFNSKSWDYIGSRLGERWDEYLAWETAKLEGRGGRPGHVEGAPRQSPAPTRTFYSVTWVALTKWGARAVWPQNESERRELHKSSPRRQYPMASPAWGPSLAPRETWEPEELRALLEPGALEPTSPVSHYF